MKEKKRVIIIIVIFFLVGLLLFLVLNKTNLLKLKSSIIDVKHGILKTYEIGDIVNFDPINYEICEDGSTSETCYKWLIISRGGNNDKFCVLVSELAVSGGRQIKLFFCKIFLDIIVLNGRLFAVDQCNLFGNDVNGCYMIVLRQKHCQ